MATIINEYIYSENGVELTISEFDDGEILIVPTIID